MSRPLRDSEHCNVSANKSRCRFSAQLCEGNHQSQKEKNAIFMLFKTPGPGFRHRSRFGGYPYILAGQRANAPTGDHRGDGHASAGPERKRLS